MGESSIIDLVAGSAERKIASPHAGCRAPGDDVRSITLDSKKFALYVSPTSESMSAAARKEGAQAMLAFLRGNGGVHLLVYCMNALRPLDWICEIHRTIASDSTQSPRVPAVAVVVGISDTSRQESWWTSATGSLADQGPYFSDHTFIQMTTTGPQSLTGDHISVSRHALHVLILHNADAEAGLESALDTQRAAFYKQRSIGNSFQSLLLMLARKPSPHRSVRSKPVDIVLLGEIGVGKSSLINLIAKDNVAGVSSDTIGCTRTASKYTFEERGRIFHLYDTPGLVDPQMGDKPFFDPIDNIQQLIHSLGNGNGPDLVLLCINNSKPTTSFRRNYRIFHEFICSSKVPFALAVTKLEGSHGAEEWWHKYGSSIRRYGIDHSRYIGLGRSKGHLDPDADAESQQRESLLSFLSTCVDRQRNGVSLRSSMERVASFVRSRASTPERSLVKQCGLEEQTARELASRIAFPKNKVHGSRPYDRSLLNSFL